LHFPPIPASLSSFFSSLSFLPPNLATSLQGLLADPSPQRFQRHFPTSPPSLDQLPHVAIGLAAEVYDVVSEIREGVKKEADGLRREFEDFKKGVEAEASKVKTAWEEATAEAEARFSHAQETSFTQSEGDVEDQGQEREQAEEDVQRDVKDSAGNVEIVEGEQSFERKGTGRAKDAEKKKLRQAKKESKKALELAKEQRRLAKEQRKEERERRRFERSFHRTSNVPSTVSPFDDLYKVEETTSVPHLAETGPTRNTRSRDAQGPFAAQRLARRASRTSPLLGDAAALPPVAEVSHVVDGVPLEKDDFFRRRVGSGSSMPGTFEHVSPVAPITQSARPLRSFTHVTGTSLDHPLPSLSRSTSAPAKGKHTIAHHSFRMPGSFDSLTTPHPAPVPSTSSRPHEPSPIAGEEVLPHQLQAAIRELGFDTRDLGVTIACERSWEQGRGKKLEELVASVLEKVLM
ncbi:hypothetical protein P7C70_g113, partial [Phenoliferia sp. Uapishka_3]